MEIILVSACILGLKTRYDGGESKVKFNPPADCIPIPICPEQMGGLPTPRPKMTLLNTAEEILKGEGKAINTEGKDVTQNLIRGAEEVLKIAKMLNIKKAILKDGSPSCGVMHTNINWERVKGKGITALLLEKNGIKIETIG